LNGKVFGVCLLKNVSAGERFKGHQFLSLLGIKEVTNFGIDYE
jgi:hypothetical protein